MPRGTTFPNTIIRTKNGTCYKTVAVFEDDDGNTYSLTEYLEGPYSHEWRTTDTFRIDWRVDNSYYYANPDGMHWWCNGLEEHRWEEGPQGKHEIRYGKSGHWMVYKDPETRFFVGPRNHRRGPEPGSDLLQTWYESHSEGFEGTAKLRMDLLRRQPVLGHLVMKSWYDESRRNCTIPQPAPFEISQDRTPSLVGTYNSFLNIAMMIATIVASISRNYSVEVSTTDEARWDVPGQEADVQEIGKWFRDTELLSIEQIGGSKLWHAQ